MNTEEKSKRVEQGQENAINLFNAIQLKWKEIAGEQGHNLANQLIAWSFLSEYILSTLRIIMKELGADNHDIRDRVDMIVKNSHVTSRELNYKKVEENAH